MFKKGNTIWTRNFIILFIANMVSNFGTRMAQTLLPLLCKEIGASDYLIGLVSSVFYFTALGFRPFSGPMIDGYNRKKLFIILMGMNAVTMFGYGMSDGMGTIIAFRLLHGISYGTSAALCMTMASAALPQDKIAGGIGTYVLSTVLPNAIGPGIGISLKDVIGYKYTYFLACAIMLAAGALGFLFEDMDNQKKKIKISLNTMFAVESTVPAIMLFLLGMASASVQSFLVLMTQDRGITGISVYYTINAAAMVFSRPIAGKLADRFGTEKIIVPCMIIEMVTLFLFATCENNITLWSCAVLNAIGYSAGYSMLQAHALKQASPERRGVASSTCYIGTDGGSLVGGVVAGALCASFGYKGLYMCEMITPALCIVIMILWVRSTRKKTAAGETAAE